VDDRAIGEGKPGPITQKLQTGFFAAAHGKIEQYKKWLTYL
jgi:branched-chain amino acid aminotransferase